MSRVVSSDPMIARAAAANAAMEQAKRNQIAKTENLILATSANIYGHLAAMELFRLEEWNAEEIVPKLRVRAQQAKEAALLLGEAYGLVRISEQAADSGEESQGS